ncbi:MAG TPA: D-glycero-beta-D-manno-heptose-7-phosphate kinase [Stellaceae bacterium]|nr:D-glycero-beta-D-manno-heptose-7-phosphate kinase [Stellaceae bacterium]
MPATIADRVVDLGRAHVAVIGDVMLDRFIYGDVERISPEAPIPVMRVDRTDEMLGGAGNVAANIASLGAHVRLVGLVGEDEAGAAVRRLVGDLSRSTATLVGRESGPTTIKTRVVARRQQVIRLDCEHIARLSPREEDAVMAAIDTAIGAADLLLLSDYGKGLLLGETAAKTIRMARERGKPVIVDPKGRDYSCYREASLITPNMSELHHATGLAVESDQDVIAAARALMRAHAIGAIIVTRGAQGMSIVTETAATHLPTVARAVFDVSGAGDTVAASIACAVAIGMDLEEAARLANAAAGIVVAKLGTSQVTPAELAMSLRHQALGTNDAKIVLPEEAAAHVWSWQAQNLKVGFTNGCFDLVHPGHLALLRQARAGCDRLIVAINSDESVRSLKGPTRPVQTELARAAVLACFDLVDLVVIFRDPTPIALIEALRPDVLVKGADYSLDQVVGAELVQSYGGRVLLAQLSQGFSTSEMIRRINRHSIDAGEPSS